MIIGKSNMGNILGNLENKIGDKDISTIHDGTITGAVQGMNNDIVVERSRITNLIAVNENAGATDIEQELTDIRVGIDGTVYDTAGDSVRKQMKKLVTPLETAKKGITKIAYSSEATDEVEVPTMDEFNDLKEIVLQLGQMMQNHMLSN